MWELIGSVFMAVGFGTVAWWVYTFLRGLYYLRMQKRIERILDADPDLIRQPDGSYNLRSKG